MPKRFRISVDGHPYDVTVEDVSDPGNLYPSQAMTTSAPAAAPAAAAPAAPATAAGVSAGPDDKVSPLGGVVDDIHVKVGDEVAAGDKICTIEAMKMKTQVTAHKAGKIDKIHISVGDAVDAGQALMTIA